MPPSAHWPAAFPPVRLLGPPDQRRCVALAIDRGWAPERDKWGMLLAASETFGVDAPDGHGLAGAVVLTRWDGDPGDAPGPGGAASGGGIAAVGMMLVAARYGRRGLGRALMEHLLRAAGEDTTVTLFATDQGRPLYEQLGFRPVRRNVSFTGQFRPAPAAGRAPRLLCGTVSRDSAGRDTADADGSAPAGTVRVAGEADLPAILAVDRVAFGAGRDRILSRLPGFADEIVVLESASGIAGYAAAWRNGPASTVIGPVVAPDGAAARLLITELAARATTPVRLDLDPDRPELPGSQACGLQPSGRSLVMAHGDPGPRGVPERLFTPISVALA